MEISGRLGWSEQEGEDCHLSKRDSPQSPRVWSGLVGKCSEVWSRSGGEEKEGKSKERAVTPSRVLLARKVRVLAREHGGSRGKGQLAVSLAFSWTCSPSELPEIPRWTTPGRFSRCLRISRPTRSGGWQWLRITVTRWPWVMARLRQPMRAWSRHVQYTFSPAAFSRL